MCFYILDFFFVNRLLYRCKIYAVTPSPCIFPSTTDAVQIGPTSYNSGQIAPSTVFAIEREVIARAWCIRPGIFSRCGFARPPLLLLRGLLRLRRLERLLPVAPNHDAGEEAADDGAAEQDQDDGDADGPDARREERLERVVFVDEGLQSRACQHTYPITSLSTRIMGFGRAENWSRPKGGYAERWWDLPSTRSTRCSR